MKTFIRLTPALSTTFFLLSSAALLSRTRVETSLALFLIGLAFLMFRYFAKTCTGCDRDNEETQEICPKCGTASLICTPASQSSTFLRRAHTMTRFIALALFIAAIVKTPALIIVIPILVIFYTPLYLPFFISFAAPVPEWRGLRWSLRLATLIAIVLWLDAMSRRPNFGNDVGGNIAGASHNFMWVWGSGIGCALVALIIGLLLHAVRVERI